MVWIGFISICCSKVAKVGKSCPRWLVLQKVAQNAKSWSNVAEHNLFMPTAGSKNIAPTAHARGRLMEIQTPFATSAFFRRAGTLRRNLASFYLESNRMVCLLQKAVYVLDVPKSTNVGNLVA